MPSAHATPVARPSRGEERMSKKGGNKKTKAPAKPPMPNKGPKKK